jgi:hypothetical protein
MCGNTSGIASTGNTQEVRQNTQASELRFLDPFKRMREDAENMKFVMME